MGLSPRLRGNRKRYRGQRGRRGSIPAPAGEPSRSPIRISGTGVYPRACGGTIRCALRRRSSRGLSPRLRGNLADLIGALDIVGSIPAPAGEPSRSCRLPGQARVYPRACGGTRNRLDGSTLDRGLSPRLRGNRTIETFGSDAKGSIPAPAGEPRILRPCVRRLRVYPRACGGTYEPEEEPDLDEGLSPRPAPAGEPAAQASDLSSRAGLSPRLRGNQYRHRLGRSRGGSIPAPAGEPPCRPGK